MTSRANLVSQTYWSRRQELGQRKYHYLMRTSIFENRAVELHEFDNYFGNLDRNQYFGSIREQVETARQKMSGVRGKFANQYREVLEREQLLVRECWANLVGAERVRSRKGRTKLKELVKDDKAIAILSSYAVNAIILERELENEQSMLSNKELMQIWEVIPWVEGNLHNKIYYWTHLVIANSLFYTKNLKPELGSVFGEKLKEIDLQIERWFEVISIDVKLEYLLALKILKLNSRIKKQILSEAERGIEGCGFVCDPRKENELGIAEHRSMLYLGIRKWNLRGSDRITRYER